MVASSRITPLMEEILKTLEEDMQRIKTTVQNQEIILQGFDVEAGQRLAMLDANITKTKNIFAETVEQVQQEYKDPKKELEARVLKLETQLEKLTKDWKNEHDLPQK